MVNQVTVSEEHMALLEDEIPIPDASQLITEDDTPVDNLPSEKQQRLLTGCLYSNLSDRLFLAAANVGIYHTVSKPAIVPDVFVSFNVSVPEAWWEKQNRCYLVWLFGKPPEIVIEVVSNQVGHELGRKLTIYEQMRVSYYAIYDPTLQLSSSPLRIFELRGIRYLEMDTTWLDQVGLGLTLWQGEFEGRSDSWLRWCDAAGAVLPTGDEQAQQARERAEQERERAEQERERAEQERERAEQAQQRAEQAQQRAEQERERAEQAQQRAEQLAALLRAQGIDPDRLPQ
ncbi:MAG: Uma2 family endonuclease [Leptolyngbyaceae cyanobacterium SM2_5_2]|nr:Uma2 family endonuclease [Leptolyngbyaceae cyanobacterium SM2_5_2]